MRSYQFELRTTATVAQVVAFYRKAMERNGLTNVSETESQNRSYALEARSADRMHPGVSQRAWSADGHARYAP